MDLKNSQKQAAPDKKRRVVSIVIFCLQYVQRECLLYVIFLKGLPGARFKGFYRRGRKSFFLIIMRKTYHSDSLNPSPGLIFYPVHFRQIQRRYYKRKLFNRNITRVEAKTAFFGEAQLFEPKMKFHNHLLSQWQLIFFT